jgi:hypothetical protein
LRAFLAPPNSASPGPAPDREYGSYRDDDRTSRLRPVDPCEKGCNAESVLVIHQPNLETLPLGLVNFTTAHSTNYPELFAALSIVTAPVVLLYLVMQRQFISGLTAGALKG